MMDQSFLALVRPPHDQQFRPVTPPPGLEPLNDTNNLRLFTTAGTPRQISHHGTILGRLFARNTMARVQTLSDDDWNAIALSGGQTLINTFWGDYVAFLPVSDDDGEHISILRAPFGRLGCYWHPTDAGIVLVSHPDLLAKAGFRVPHIDAPALARHIAQPEIAHSQTCLRDVFSLAGGERLTPLRSGPRIDSLWSPWRFCSDRPEIGSVEHAGRVLRDVVTTTVAAQTSGFGNLVLMLSGGLDSSVLAACLRIADRPFHALTLVTQAAIGDERTFARMAAQATGAPLTEAFRSLDGVDLLVSCANRAARPFARSFTQESDRLAALLAEQQGADAIVDGGCGDNLFFNYLTLAALVEIWRGHGFGPRFRQAAAAFADLTGSSIASVTARTVYRALTRDNRLRMPERTSFLSQSARAAVAHLPLHPWLLPPPAIGAGKAAHVSLLMPVQAGAEQGPPLNGSQPRLSPLVCQPVIETVLGLPIWCWFAPGRNRAAARAAFEDDLPSALITRRSKGTPNPFMHSLFEQHRALIRSMLLDGRLADLGLIDTDALRTTLDSTTPSRDFTYAQIMELVDAEAWARSWD